METFPLLALALALFLALALHVWTGLMLTAKVWDLPYHNCWHRNEWWFLGMVSSGNSTSENQQKNTWKSRNVRHGQVFYKTKCMVGWAWAPQPLHYRWSVVAWLRDCARLRDCSRYVAGCSHRLPSFFITSFPCVLFPGLALNVIFPSYSCTGLVLE